MLAGNYFASGKGGEAFVFLRVLSPCFFFSLFFLSIFFFFFGLVWGIRRTPVPWGCGLGVVEDRLWHICRWLQGLSLGCLL